MIVEFVDQLRCPNPHAQSVLVASVERMEGRNVAAGVLGCPVCRAQFPIDSGVADFRRVRNAPSGTASGRRASVDQAMRLAAFLNLVDASGYAVLLGEWSIHAPALRSLVATHLLLVNPPDGLSAGDGTSGIAIDDALPVAPASARGVALDTSATPALVDASVQALAPRGRMVAPVSVPVPTGITELARDAEVWVGVKEPASSAMVELRRGNKTAGY